MGHKWHLSHRITHIAVTFSGLVICSTVEEAKIQASNIKPLFLISEGGGKKHDLICFMVQYRRHNSYIPRDIAALSTLLP